MKFILFALSALSLANAESKSAVHRRLSYEKIAGYSPGSQVTDHCAIDRDQAAIEVELAKKTNQSFEAARQIYNQGGNSKSYATVTLSSPLSSQVPRFDTISGKNEDGLEVIGKALFSFQPGDSEVRIQYATTDVQASYVDCQVGGLADTNTKGCFAASGFLEIGGSQYAYSYDPNKDNDNARTIAGFSTTAGDRMRLSCPGCPYTDFLYFYNYYGFDDYADQWVNAAFNGESTNFRNGNADFSKYGFDGRWEAIMKGTAYMNIFMYVIRELEDAMDDCKRGCIDCNDDVVHAWDEGVCFYTGSIEGQDGLTSDGKLLHQLADKRCQNFKTCGPDSGETEGTAWINYEIFDLFALGKFQLETGNCPNARKTLRSIIELMYIPMIQGTLRYAVNVGVQQGGEKAKAEGAIFAAAVLPRVHAANPEAAKTIYDSMKVGATSTDNIAVKKAFESVYADMGIKCADVGGVWNSVTDTYYDGMGPCTDASTIDIRIQKEEDKALAVILGATF
jgi:hypothetical protein